VKQHEPRLVDEVHRWNDRLRLLAHCTEIERAAGRPPLDDDLRQVTAELRSRLDTDAAQLNWHALVFFDGVGWDRIRERHPWLARLQDREWGRAVVRSTFAVRVIGEPWPDDVLRPQEIEGWALPLGEPRSWWKLEPDRTIVPATSPDSAFADRVLVLTFAPSLSRLLTAPEERREEIAATLSVLRGERVEPPAPSGMVARHALDLLARRLVLGESWQDLANHLQTIAPRPNGWTSQAVQKVVKPLAARLGVN
jgi:hypothetical protein